MYNVKALVCSVEYTPEFRDNSWASYVEKAANICHAPGRWLADGIWGTPKKVVSIRDYALLEIEEIKYPETGRVLRLALGILFCIPGTLLTIPLKAIALQNEEIGLKHKVVLMNYTKDEKNRLLDLVKERKSLSQNQQKCEPLSCSLCSICCMLCFLVFFKK